MLLGKRIEAREANKSNEKNVFKRLFVIEETAGFGTNLKKIIEDQLLDSIPEEVLSLRQTKFNLVVTYYEKDNTDFVSLAVSTLQKEVLNQISQLLAAHYDVVEF